MYVCLFACKPEGMPGCVTQNENMHGKIDSDSDNSDNRDT